MKLTMVYPGWRQPNNVDSYRMKYPHAFPEFLLFSLLSAAQKPRVQKPYDAKALRP